MDEITISLVEQIAQKASIPKLLEEQNKRVR